MDLKQLCECSCSESDEYNKIQQKDEGECFSKKKKVLQIHVFFFLIVQESLSHFIPELGKQ